MDDDGPPKLGPTTRALQAVHAASAAFAVPAAGGERPHVLPIVQTANYDYPDAASADQAAQGKAYLYSRVGNPTVDAFARVVAELEGAERGLAFGSGMAAISSAILSQVQRGQRILAAEGLYGTTHELLHDQLPRFGVDTTFVDACDLGAVERGLQAGARLLYVETITNPLVRVPDLPALGRLCREHGARVIVDNTFATPLLARPLEHGATLVVHSASKYLGGHGDIIAGVVCGGAEAVRAAGEMLKIFGGMLDPFAAWLALRGIRTMPLRVERQVATAHFVATALAGTPRVVRVHYPGLPGHPDHEVAKRVLAGPGAMLSFEVEGGLEGARRVYDRARVIRRASSLGEIESLFTHPASFSHRGVSAEERARTGIGEGLLRLSIGIEDPVDLIDDLHQALAV
jgi:methionine-gamma-lyase